MSFNFITKHLVSKITQLVEEKQKKINCKGFFYFDEIIIDPRIKIDRLDRWNAYPKEQILPVSWYMLNSKTLLKIYQMLKENKFYAYKQINKKDYKVRIKNETTRT